MNFPLLDAAENGVPYPHQDELIPGEIQDWLGQDIDGWEPRPDFDLWCTRTTQVRRWAMPSCLAQLSPAAQRVRQWVWEKWSGRLKEHDVFVEDWIDPRPRYRLRPRPIRYKPYDK